MKCPKCGYKVVPILYGLPSDKDYIKFEKKELYLGGCEVIIGLPMAKYHCYNCDINIYDDLSVENTKDFFINE